jgi:hypothetical protein
VVFLCLFILGATSCFSFQDFALKLVFSKSKKELALVALFRQEKNTILTQNALHYN